MKWSAEQEDVSLLPYMTGTEKEALRRTGVSTVQALATLKDFAPGQQGRLDAGKPGREAQVKQIAATWPVGPRLDELVHRARSFRRSVRKDGTQAISYIPGKGNSTLPVSKPDLNPNLVQIAMSRPNRTTSKSESTSSVPWSWPARTAPRSVGGPWLHDGWPARLGSEGTATFRGLDP